MSYCVVCPTYGRTGEDDRSKPRYSEQGWLTCLPCHDRIHSQLRELPDLYAVLDATPGTTAAGGKVSGSREAPLGVRVDVLDLITSAPAGTVRDIYGDQVGHQPVGVTLDLWVTDWADTRGRGEHRPIPTIPVLCSWLIDRLDWACREHPAIDSFAGEIKQVMGALRMAVYGPQQVRAEHRPGVPCRRPQCSYMEMYREPDGYTKCHVCGDLLNQEEWDRWVRLVAAGHSWSEVA